MTYEIALPSQFESICWIEKHVFKTTDDGVELLRMMLENQSCIAINAVENGKLLATWIVHCLPNCGSVVIGSLYGRFGQLKAFREAIEYTCDFAANELLAQRVEISLDAYNSRNRALRRVYEGCGFKPKGDTLVRSLQHESKIIRRSRAKT